jgi:hypothetical protein
MTRRFATTFLFFALLGIPLLACSGCGGPEVDTSHREEPGFVDAAADPTAIMPSGADADKVIPRGAKKGTR